MKTERIYGHPEHQPDTDLEWICYALLIAACVAVLIVASLPAYLWRKLR